MNFQIFQFNLKLKLVDIDLVTLNIDVNVLKKAINQETKAIFAVNLLGNPNKFDEILNICKDNNLILFEDNCEAMGAKYINIQERLGLLVPFLPSIPTIFVLWKEELL